MFQRFQTAQVSAMGPETDALLCDWSCPQSVAALAFPKALRLQSTPILFNTTSPTSFGQDRSFGSKCAVLLHSSKKLGGAQESRYRSRSISSLETSATVVDKGAALSIRLAAGRRETDDDDEHTRDDDPHDAFVRPTRSAAERRAAAGIDREAGMAGRGALSIPLGFEPGVEAIAGV